MKKTIALLLIVVLAVVVAFPRVTSAERDGQGAQAQGHQSDDHDHGDHGNQGSHKGQSGDHEHDHQENQAEDEETQLEIRLTGASQVPAVNTNAFGRAEVELSENGTALTFEIQVCDIANVTASHIHVGNSTTNGPVILFLFKAGATAFSSTDGCSELVEGVLTPADLIPNMGAGINNWTDFVNALRSGNTYINVHTTAHPAGEIRGQLVGEDEDENEGDD